MSARSRSQRGFTLIELLIVVMILGIIAAIAVPNTLRVLHNAKQKRTMADMRALGTALHMYEDDVSAFPVTTEQDASYLVPMLNVYIKTVVNKDGWGSPIRYASDGVVYTITSYGRDGAPTLPYTLGVTTDLDEDMLYSQGIFIQYPAGVQTD